MRIAVINTVFDRGGAARVMGGIVAAACAAGHRCLVAAARGDAAVVEAMCRGGVAAGRGGVAAGRGDVTTYRIEGRLGVLRNVVEARLRDNDGFLASRATRRLIARLEEWAPDVIHLHNLHGYYIDSRLLFDYIRRSGCRVVWTLHDCWSLTGHCARFTAIGCNGWESGCERCGHTGEYPRCVTKGRPAWNFALKRLTFSGVERLRIVTPSEWLRRLVKRSHLGSYEVNVIPNGVDVERFKPRESEVKARLGIEGRPMLLSVASVWIKIKGIDDIVALAERLGDDYAMVMVGVDERLRQRLPGGIIALPRTSGEEELSELYTAADLLVNVSREETFGLTSLEALACGTPVLVYSNTAGPESVRGLDGDCGIVVDIGGGAEAVAAAIEGGKWREISAERCIAHAAKYAAGEVYSHYNALYEWR